MRINWKVRLKNKVWVTSFIALVVGFIYQLLGMLGVVAPISEDQLVNILGMVINLLVALGVIVDPTTDGVNDSDRAMTY